MMPTDTSCNVATLSIYTPSSSNPWNKQKVNHLYRRIGFGASSSMMTEALTKTPSSLVDQLVQEALDLVPTAAPRWGYWVRDQFLRSSTTPPEYKRIWKTQIIDDLSKNNLRDRLTLFWSNHFVTEELVYQSPAYMFQYYNLLQLHALGNFKAFVKDIGLSSAMLVYLNGFESTKNDPNENYARELYELFTLGVDNGYDQNDIIETSRALTGWNKEDKRWGPILFDTDNFDDGTKTIFGQTGNWGYDDVIDILFTQRTDQIAKFICKKLYRYFISPNSNETIINQLATTFVDNDFEIAPVMKQLFKSEHFFDEKSIGVIIKSPIDIQVSFLKELDFKFASSFNVNSIVRGGSINLGQDVMNPIDVAGWQGDTDWIDSSSLTTRWDLISRYLSAAWVHNQEQFRTIAKEIIEGNSNDVELVSRSIMDYFFSRELVSETDYSQALVIFKDQVPENYFEDGTWDLDWDTAPRQVFQLLKFLIKIPEFQLK
ncbi:DUF1800 domain-containing protein [Aquimarina algicola]|uniref:DUF1800 domain-containing protein n=1 Tax=Aquimarina algicola TaxID=2589995 RepID=A0A504IZE5_9FLAO|nr:DUF1800 domain-containing protein [Aquimarina algicola]TPN83907.1 DUF1800 domain-containing protein [Aquimarina algicola]